MYSKKSNIVQQVKENRAERKQNLISKKKDKTVGFRYKENA
jgi:hypothetical protein